MTAPPWAVLMVPARSGQQSRIPCAVFLAALFHVRPGPSACCEQGRREACCQSAGL